jgi:hypothetical protein
MADQLFKRWIVRRPFRAFAMLFLFLGFIKFLVYHEWGYAIFCGFFVGLGVFFNLREFRLEDKRGNRSAPTGTGSDPSLPIHPE